MKLAQSIALIQATGGLTGHVQIQAIVTTISFLNAHHSNFLNLPDRQAGAFFMRPVPRAILSMYLAETPSPQRASVALAGQTGGAIRVVLDFLFLLHQGKRKSIIKSFLQEERIHRKTKDYNYKGYTKNNSSHPLF